MTKERRQKFIEAATTKHHKQFDGYVCVGHGDAKDDIRSQIGVTYESLYATDSSGNFINGWNGNLIYKLYYLTQDKWNEIFGEVEDTSLNQKEMTMDEKVNYAKGFIGKRIVSRTNSKLYGLVDSVEVHLNTDIIIKNNSTSHLINIFSKEFNKSGYVVALRGEWDDNTKMVYVISDDGVTLAPDTIKINGYESEDKGDYIQFGCAKISRDLLKCVEFLMLTTFDDDNRKVESVKIGAGEFTLEDIQTLLR